MYKLFRYPTFLFVSLFLVSCVSSPSPSQIDNIELTPTSISTNTPIPSPTNTPTPFGFQTYHIEFEVESISPKVWVPAPRYWDGNGVKNIEYVEISPEPSDWFREENGTEILYWENLTGNAQIFRLVFNVELVFSDNTSALKLEFPNYDTNTYLYQKYTISQEDIQSDTDEIIDLALSIYGDETNPYVRAKLIHTWMVNNISSDSSPRDALSTLRNRGNDCAGKAHLYVALLRASGIPARNVSGIHSPGQQYIQSGNWWPDKSMGYHVWVEFYLPQYGWVQSDPGNPDMFDVIEEHRIITSKGNDIRIGLGFPNNEISWFHLPYNTDTQIEDEPIRFTVTKITD